MGFLLGGTVTSVFGHDPFDCVTRLFVQRDTIEIEVTIGSDAARELLKGAGLPGTGVAKMTRSGNVDDRIELPSTVAAHLFKLTAGGNLLEAQSCVGRPGETESMIIATYSKPPTEALLIEAQYFELIPDVRPGPFAAADQDGQRIATALLTKESSSVTVPLRSLGESHSGEPTRPAEISFYEFLNLGIKHILIGFDHLLFLCALLAGVQKIRPMLVIITCFTFGHSITLALAALEWVTVSSGVIEPLIAASIIFVGLENIFRANITWDRYWVAGGFGLIHGFGFASVLRETGLSSSGGSVVMPLFSFNLGVEVGQLLVAAAVVPLLLLLRRRPGFARYTLPVLSALVIVISGYWLLERTVFYSN